MPTEKLKNIHINPRLADILNRVSQHSVILIEAPDGWGKTTAALKIAERMPGRQALVTAEKDTRTDLWGKLCGFMQKWSFSLYEEMLRNGIPIEEESRQNLREKIGRMADGRFGGFILILDDCRTFDEEATEDLLAWMAAHMPEHVRLILSAEHIPDRIREAAESAGCLKVGREELAMDEADIADYMAEAEIRPGTLTPSLLYTWTQGQPLLLWLYFSGRQQGLTLSGPMTAFSLIERTVFGPLSAQDKALLGRLADAPAFTEAEAGQISDAAAGEFCSRFAENCVLVRKDGEGRYWYHPQLKLFVSTWFRKKNRAVWQEYLRRIGQWEESCDRLYEAVLTYARAEDFGSVLRVFAGDRGEFMPEEDRDRMIRWFPRMLRGERQQDLFGLICYARRLLQFGETETFARIEDFLETDISMTELPELTRKKLIGECELNVAYMYFNDIRMMASYQKFAVLTMAGKSRLYRVGDCWTYGSPSVVSLYHREPGRLAQETRVLIDSLPDLGKYTGHSGAGGGQLMEAEGCYLKGRIQEANEAVHAAQYLTRKGGQTSVNLAALFLQIRIAVHQKDPDHAVFILQEMQKTAEGMPRLYLDMVDQAAGWLGAAIRREELIPPWLKAVKAYRRVPREAAACRYAIANDCLLSLGRYEEILNMLPDTMAAAVWYPQIIPQIYLHIQTAIACQHIGRGKDSVQQLRSAMALAEPDQIIMPFAEYREIPARYYRRVAGTDEHLTALADKITALRGEEK